jgi:hypothetical protein
VSVKDNPPFLWWKNATDDIEEGGFPASIRPDDSDQFPSLDFEAHLIDRHQPPKAFRDVLKLEQCHCFRPFIR